MAGTSTDFSASEFRSQLQDTMRMGMPTTVAEQLTWKWNTQRTFVHADPAGVPYDLTATAVTEDDHADVIVPYAVVFGAVTADETSFGTFDKSQATISLCDTDWETVKTADYVTIGGDIYDIDSVVSQGLFDFTLYTIHVNARSKA